MLNYSAIDYGCAATVFVGLLLVASGLLVGLIEGVLRIFARMGFGKYSEAEFSQAAFSRNKTANPTVPEYGATRNTKQWFQRIHRR